VHTMLVLWRAVCCLPELYDPLNQKQKNAVMWACLMHDLRKLSMPALEGRDHIHPFKSASCVLEVFYNLGFIEKTQKNLQDITTVKRLISESVQPI